MRIWLLLLNSTSWHSWRASLCALESTNCCISLMRDALREVLADFELFLSQIPLPKEVECYHCQCHHVLALPSITFTFDDMLVKSSDHNWPLYYTGYIGTTKIEKILIDSASVLNIISLLQFLRIAIQKLATTTPTIMVSMLKTADLWGRIA